MQNQTCIITGANGFIGKHLCNYFDKNHRAYRPCVRKATSGVEFEYGDLLQFKNWQEMFLNAGSVIHLAAKVHDMSTPDPQEYLKFNTDLTKKLAEQAKMAGVSRFVFISSIKVNGEFTLDRPFTADDTPRPQDPYGVSKMLAEQELLKLHEPGRFDVTIIRPCLIYGNGVKANFNSLVKLVKRGWPLPFASIKNRRSLVAVDNLIDLIDVTLKNPAASGEIFLVSDGRDLSLPELIHEIAQALGKKALLLPFPKIIFKVFFKLLGKPGLTVRLFGNLQVDISKTKTKLNWQPRYSMQEALKKMLA